MPLDTQPLSPARRVILILVLTGLLLGALGVAQLLVMARGGGKAVWERPWGGRGDDAANALVIFKPPAGFTAELPQYADLPDVRLACGGEVDGSPRKLVGLYYPLDADPDHEPGDEARALLARLVKGPVDGMPMAVKAAMLAGYPASDLRAQVEPVPESEFWFIRLAVVHGRAVAICLSGTGPRTDQDSVFFEDFCRNRVVIDDGTGPNE